MWSGQLLIIVTCRALCDCRVPRLAVNTCSFNFIFGSIKAGMLRPQPNFHECAHLVVQRCHGKVAQLLQRVGQICMRLSNGGVDEDAEVIALH